MPSGFARPILLRCLSCLFAATMSLGTTATALEPATPLSRLGRQAWTMENGLPQNTVPVLMQSRNGFLWTGTELGLARFDGVSFQVFDHATTKGFPDAEIRCLLDSGDGVLWVGTSDGVARWQNGVATLLTTHDGLPSNGIQSLAQTTDGVVWAWTEAGLARWDGVHFQQQLWHEYGGAGINSIAADSNGGLWIGTTQGFAVFREGAWHAGSDADERTGTSDQWAPALVKALPGGDVLIGSGTGLYAFHAGKLSAIASKTTFPADDFSFLDRLADGTLAVANKSSVTLIGNSVTANGNPAVQQFAVGRELPGSRIEAVFADREGCLWVGTNRGLTRIVSGHGVGPSVVELMPASDPLASIAVVSLLEDREGDIWVGTETAGLHILRDSRFRMLGSSDGLNSDATTAIVQDSQAATTAFWIGSRDAGLNRVALRPDGTRSIISMTTANGLISNVILSLAQAPDGALWVGTPDGLNRVGNGAVASYTSADGLPDDFIRSVLAAPDGSVWIGTRRGLTNLEHGHFLNYTTRDGLGSDLVGALALTHDGTLWIATLNGLSRMHAGKIANFTTADGLSSDVITALEAAPDGKLWIGTQNDGLNLWDGQRFLALSRKTGKVAIKRADDLPEVIHAISLDSRGHLWLATDSGLTRLDVTSLLECSKRQDCDLMGVHGVNFSTADGLRSREMSGNSHPTVSRAADGMLWFTSPRGVVIVDPLHFPATSPAPPVAVERFAVDDRDIPAGNTVNAPRITAGALRFQFDYAGLSFAAPQKLRYQYTLEGFDHGWTDAGSRRTAYYTNIPPGAYRFRVRAALSEAAFTNSPDGASGGGSATDSYAPQEASVSFVLRPHYYQTYWFGTLAVLAVAGLILLVFRRRVLRVEREFGAVMGERNRIAREIHDTLAQGYVGISLQLEILGELLRHNRGDAAAKLLKMTQDMVRDGLNDARQSIWALRSQDTGEQTLPIRLRRMVEQADDSRLQAHFEVFGAYRALSAETEQEILRIAQEAIQNVKKHAAARHLGVRLEYEQRSLTLTVADDGRGFEPATLAALHEGHYGLTGMQERAALVHGQFTIVSQPGMGASVRLVVPAPEAQ